MKILIIGGVAGGASCAARLRRLDENAEIVVLERGGYVSFANCGLPYYVGGEIRERSALMLQTPESFWKRFRVEVRCFHEAVAVDPEAKRVRVLDLTTGRLFEEEYNKLVLSPGALPIRPPIEGIDSEGVFTLRGIPDADGIMRRIADRKPGRALVVGGGYIGVEMAENLTRAGLETTILELSDHLLAPLDGDMAADVHHYLRKRGVRLLLGQRLIGIRREGEGLTALTDRGSLSAELVILSVGVRPDTAFLASSGLERDARGCILTDERMRTSAPGVYAVGDAVSVRNAVTGEPAFLPLAGPANRQGRIAADNICGIPSEYRGTQGTSILKIFDMTAAATGLNEKSAEAAGIRYDKTYLSASSHASYYPGASGMSLKILWERDTNRLIGAQIVGFDGVDKRMDVLATALRLGARVTDLASLELCYAPPFGSAKDPVNMAGFIAENVISGRVKQFFPQEVDALPRDGSVTLLDVRTEAERELGRIDGFLSIPLDSLRSRADELPRGKTVYVHCHSGLRSYIACRILTGLGLDCRNLAGGWLRYDALRRDRESGD